MQNYLNTLSPNQLQALFYVALLVMGLAGIGIYQLLKGNHE